MSAAHYKDRERCSSSDSENAMGGGGGVRNNQISIEASLFRTQLYIFFLHRPPPQCEREPELQTVKPEGHFPAAFQHAPPARLHGHNKTKPLQPPVIICLFSQQSEKS